MKSKAGFTLIEILIAVAIFSIAMVIAYGIFSNIVGSQSLVSVSSEANHEDQRILRQISDDTVNAVVTGSVATVNGAVITVDQNLKPQGILFLTATKAVATPAASCVPNCNFPGIALFTTSGIKIYFYDAASKTMQYAVNTKDPTSDQLLLTNTTNPSLSPNYEFKTLNDNSVEVVSTSNGFTGFVCYNSSCNQQPYIKLDLTVETKNYSNLSARHRALIELRTMITGRSY